MGGEFKFSGPPVSYPFPLTIEAAASWLQNYEIGKCNCPSLAGNTPLFNIIWQLGVENKLLDPANQCRRISSRIPNVDNMYCIVCLVVVIDDLKTAIHQVASTI